MNYKKKSLIIYGVLIIGFILSLIVVALVQLNIPYSSRAFLEYQIVPVYSKVSGEVEKIYVKDGEKVKVDQPLFKLDDDLYEASYISAKGSYNEVVESIENLKNDIIKCRDILLNDQEIYERNQNEYKKYEILYKKRYISEIDLDKMKTKVLEAEKSLRESSGKLENLLVKYRENENSISSILKAKGNLEKAKLNLDYTTVLSPINGEVVMDNFYLNTPIKSGGTVFYIKNDDVLKVNVDLKEKGIGRNNDNREALVLFDGVPGKIFKGKVEKINPILSQGYSSSNTLVTIQNDNRWVRDSGKVRMTIFVENSKDIKKLASGSKASVILLSSNNNVIYNFFAKIWINIIKVFNYVY